MTAWRCENCGRVHRSNPSECRNCGHTVFQQARDEEAATGIDRLRLLVLAAVALAILAGAVYVLVV
ncbi:MAG: hypothetical protein ABEJ71_01200 [Halodesulfurarchaeum sp.]